MENETLYLLFTETGTILSEAIKLHTKEKYNHTSISFDSTLTDVYSFGRKTPHNPLNGGFVKEDLRLFPFTHANCAIYSLSVTVEQKKELRDFIFKFEKESDMYVYNFIGLFGILIQKEIKRKNAFFCSQFVSTALQENRIATFNKPFCFITPRDIQDLPDTVLHYEGTVADYLVNELNGYEPTQSFSRIYRLLNNF